MLSALALVAGGSVAAAGCRHAAPPAGEGELVAEGRIAVTGTDRASWATLVREDAASLVLVGPAEPELRRLSGARVRVEGRPAVDVPGEGIEVHRYEIVEIDGRRPFVGDLGSADGAAWLLLPDEADPVRLVGLPADAVASGSRIWVIGERRPDAIAVASYGVLRGP